MMNKYSTPEETLKELIHLKIPFPRDAVEAAIQQKEEITPLLLELFKQNIQNEENISEDYVGAIFASHLLSQFREKKAFPLFVQLAELPEEKIDLLIGADGITESMHRFLASTYNGDLQELKNIIEQKPVSDWLKLAALKSILLLTNEKTIDKKESFQYLNSLFTNPLFSKNKTMMGCLIYSCCDISLKSFYDNIKIAFNNQMVDEKIITMEDVESELAKPQKEYGQKYHQKLIKDTVEELQRWYCFKSPIEQKEEDDKIKKFLRSIQIQTKGIKTGRNDLCPCGSGKKFKKCCLM